MKKRRRLREGLKTLLILLLSVSAVYLSALTLFPDKVAGLIRLPQQSARPSQSRTDFQGQTLRPAAFAVTSAEGRYALLYHQEDQEGYARLSALLSQALSAAGSPTPATQAQWRLALSGPNLFCEYLGSLPLDTLSRWLSQQDNAALAGCSAPRLCVTAGALYFYADGPYVCPLSADLSEPLRSFAASFTPNGARFAFEDAAYRSLRPDSLVLEVTPSAPRLVGEDPAEVTGGVAGDTLDRMLQTLSFHPQTNSLYAITGGYAINDGSDTLRIVDGALTFHQSAEDPARYPVSGDPLDLCRTLAEGTVGACGGAAHLYLQSVETEDGVTTVTYAYAYRGAAIRLGAQGWCAQFTVENGAVTALRLRPRRYTVSEEAAVVLLPQEQAAAGLGGSGRTMRMLYADELDRGSIQPFWAGLNS